MLIIEDIYKKTNKIRSYMEHINRAGWQVSAQSLGCNHVLRAVLQTRKDHHSNRQNCSLQQIMTEHAFRINTDYTTHRIHH